MKMNLGKSITIANNSNYTATINNYEEEKKEILDIDNIRIDYKQIVNDFLNMKNPTKEMIHRIINKIYITKDKKVEIHYNIKDFNAFGDTTLL